MEMPEHPAPEGHFLAEIPGFGYPMNL